MSIPPLMEDLASLANERSERYPPLDLSDPLAPLSVLRTRRTESPALLHRKNTSVPLHRLNRPNTAESGKTPTFTTLDSSARRRAISIPSIPHPQITKIASGYDNLQNFIQHRTSFNLDYHLPGAALTRDGMASRSTSLLSSSQNHPSPDGMSRTSSPPPTAHKGLRLLRMSVTSSNFRFPPSSSTLSSPAFPPTPTDIEPLPIYHLTQATRTSQSGSHQTSLSTMEFAQVPNDTPPSLLFPSLPPSDGQFPSSQETIVPTSPVRKRRKTLKKSNSRRRPHTPKTQPPPLKTSNEDAKTERFDEHIVPTREQLLVASSLELLAEDGAKVRFGDLWIHKKTIVCFIRHFWCPLCQDYMASISQVVDPATLKKAGLDLIIVSNGSPAMIKGYRQIFQSPFRLYTDPTLKLYNALGMTLQTLDPGPEDKRGKYVKHGFMGGVMMVIKNAVKFGLPVWEQGGEISQLGGEFVLGPGLQCTYAHRMRTTRGHIPISEVLAAAGINLLAQVERPSLTTAERSIFSLNEEQEEEWMEVRTQSWLKIQSMKNQRRRGISRNSTPCGFSLGEEEEVSPRCSTSVQFVEGAGGRVRH